MSFVPNRVHTQLAASGAITVPNGDALYAITLGSAAALTLAAPTVDGLKLTIVSETAFAHTVAATAVNGGTTNNLLTFGAAVGKACELVSRNGFWWAVMVNGVTVS